MAERPPAEVLYEGRWLRLRRQGRWEYAERTHAQGLAVVILAVTPDDEVLFVEQHRAALDARTVEFPAGLVGDQHDDEGVVEAARRELVEETGWAAERVETMLAGTPSAGMSSEILTLVRASGLRRVGPGGGDGTEDIAVHAVPRPVVPAWLQERAAAGAVLDLKLWTGLWLLDHRLDGTPRD